MGRLPTLQGYKVEPKRAGNRGVKIKHGRMNYQARTFSTVSSIIEA